MESKRSREDILASILEITSSPVNKTMIMYKANMSFSQQIEYLDLLKRQQLIENKGGKWVIAARGREYLQAYGALQRIMGEMRQIVLRELPKRRPSPLKC